MQVIAGESRFPPLRIALAYCTPAQFALEKGHFLVPLIRRLAAPQGGEETLFTRSAVMMNRCLARLLWLPPDSTDALDLCLACERCRRRHLCESPPLSEQLGPRRWPLMPPLTASSCLLMSPADVTTSERCFADEHVHECRSSSFSVFEA